MRKLMHAPTASRIEDYLGRVVAHAADLRPPHPVGSAPSSDTDAAPGDTTEGGAAQLYRDASPTDPQDAYNALKAYLMLADGSRVEATHLGDQLTRFWRGWLESNRGAMPREDMLRAAGRLMSFHVQQSASDGWPQVELRYSLVDDSRETLRQVMKGTPARDRVYAQIKARAATRFSPVTVAGLLDPEQSGGVVVGSYQVPGTFTRKAWEEYVQSAIREAATTELSSTDWVLDSTVSDDLTLAGSPDHVAAELTSLYKAEYAREWARFLQGVSVARFDGFGDAVAGMNHLGDPERSPLRTVLQTVNEQTSWDNPNAGGAAAEAAKGGIVGWFNRVVMRRNRTPVNLQVDADDIPAGYTDAGAVGGQDRQGVGVG